METLTDYKAKAKVLGFIRACDELNVAKSDKATARLEATVMSFVFGVIAVGLAVIIMTPSSDFDFGNVGKTICTVSISVILGALAPFAIKSEINAREASKYASEAQNAYNEAYLEAWKVAV